MLRIARRSSDTCSAPTSKVRMTSGFMDLNLFRRRSLRGPQRSNVHRLFALNGFGLDLKFRWDIKSPVFLYKCELSSCEARLRP